MHYLPHTAEDVRKALETIGVDSIDALFADLPETLRNPDIDLPAGMDEVALLRHLRALAARNRVAEADFLGGGTRRHFLPSVTPHLALQSEFVTAYTPYQPEVAQGVLQATFEYQTMMCELTGLDASNASMYDGASAAAEAALLAVRHTGRERVLVSRGVNPQFREVLATYLRPLGIAIDVLDLDPLTTPVPSGAPLDEGVACVMVQQPNHLGYLERMPAQAEAAHAVGALFVAVVDGASLAVLEAPGVYGADVAVGDGQTLGNPSAFGGPSFGFLVVRQSLLRQLPGRLVGETVDVDGRRAFVLTLQAREQHIRRSKAKSNICSNHQLAALMAAVNLSALGPSGLRRIVALSAGAAHRLADALHERGLRVERAPAFLDEFVVRTARPAAEVRRELARRGIDAGVPVAAEYGLGNAVLLAATELVRERDIADLAQALLAMEEGVRA